MTQTITESATDMVRRLALRLGDSEDIKQDITDAIMDEMAGDLARTAALLREVLPVFVHHRLTVIRRESVDPSGWEDITPLPTPPPVIIADPAPSYNPPVPVDSPGPKVYVSYDGKSFPSPKQRAAYEARAKLLATRYGTEHGMRTLGSMTAADLEWAAAERRKMAAGNLAEAERLDELRAALFTYRAATAADLPPVELGRIMIRS